MNDEHFQNDQDVGPTGLEPSTKTVQGSDPLAFLDAEDDAAPSAEEALLKGMYPSMSTVDIPSADAPADEEMRAIRSDWTMYPAEVNKAIPHDAFDEVIGTSGQVGERSVKATRGLVSRGISEVRALVGDLGMTSDEATKFLNDIKRVGKGKPVSGDQRINGRETAVERLNTEHGEEASKALRAAQAYVAKNPKLANLLERTGLGDDPATIATIARRALELHRAGKLKIK